MAQRIPSGIVGLDERMEGGFVQGSMNLVTGKTGTGKTAFCANFLYGGIQNDETAVYVTTEERAEDLADDIYEMFGWDLFELEEQNLARVIASKPMFPSKEIKNINRLTRSYISDLLSRVNTAIDEVYADRVIIDSISVIELFIKDEYLARAALSSLLDNLREAGVTAVLTGSVPETSEGLSGGGIIEYLVDTVMLLEFVPVSEGHDRTLTIRKMRRTDHDFSIMPISIQKNGVVVESV